MIAEDLAKRRRCWFAALCIATAEFLRPVATSKCHTVSRIRTEESALPARRRKESCDDKEGPLCTVPRKVCVAVFRSLKLLLPISGVSPQPKTCQGGCRWLRSNVHRTSGFLSSSFSLRSLWLFLSLRLRPRSQPVLAFEEQDHTDGHRRHEDQRSRITEAPV